MDLKETLNLPKTDFPMKANLPKREPQILELWKDLYEKIKKERKGKPRWVLHDGPPYANGAIHIGHALNKILKDVINKYELMLGKELDFVPGWDCHGLPIELKVEEQLKEKGLSKEQVPKPEFRRMCREYAAKWVEVQKRDFVRLGVLGDWKNPYLTMDPAYQATEIRELGRIFRRGIVYRGKKPVYWCIFCTTAEAEAEVEYSEKKDPSVFVKFRVKNPESLAPNLKDRKVYAIIWTTTPWTLPANLGIMVNPEAEYALVEMGDLTPGDEVFIVAKELMDSFFEQTGLPEGIILGTVKGEKLVGLEYEHPFNTKEFLSKFLSPRTVENMWKIYPSEFVTLDAGTGLVHMAPGHGAEDYAVGKRYGLEPFAPVDDEGRYTDEVIEPLRGLRIYEQTGRRNKEGYQIVRSPANYQVIEILKEKNALASLGDLKHSYPHCWRCKSPVIFRATPQWFIAMDEPMGDLPED
ncbi:MAG: class I tRNA ligase family protein [Aquificae bacterium]|nr:class I tRNA ligase family protein [Aquificota bacterium]